MVEFDKIHVAWRKGAGERRISVGILQKLPDGTHTFQYVDNIDTLKKDQGFIPYTEFQDTTKEYTGNVAEIFGQRLMKTDRPDAKSFFKFWEVDTDKVHDKFYLLGKTQGLVPTDNFEFLAEYKLSENTHFLTELAGLSQYKHPKGTLDIGDNLRFELEKTNPKDPEAVSVFKGDIFIGYIKKYHNLIFHEPNADIKLKLSVKALDQNGIIKKAFIKVTV